MSHTCAVGRLFRTPQGAARSARTEPQQIHEGNDGVPHAGEELHCGSRDRTQRLWHAGERIRPWRTGGGDTCADEREQADKCNSYRSSESIHDYALSCIAFVPTLSADRFEGYVSTNFCFIAQGSAVRRHVRLDRGDSSRAVQTGDGGAPEVGIDTTARVSAGVPLAAQVWGRMVRIVVDRR